MVSAENSGDFCAGNAQIGVELAAVMDFVLKDCSVRPSAPEGARVKRRDVFCELFRRQRHDFRHRLFMCFVESGERRGCIAERRRPLL